MNSHVTFATNLTQVLGKTTLRYMVWHIRLKNILKVMFANEKSLLSNFDSSLWELGVGNFS